MPTSSFTPFCSALRLRRLTSTLPGLPGPLASCGFDWRLPHDFSSHGGSFVRVSTDRPFLQASNLSPGFRKTVSHPYLFWPRVVTASHHSQLLDLHSPSFSQPSLNPASCLQRIPLLTSPQWTPVSVPAASFRAPSESSYVACLGVPANQMWNLEIRNWRSGAWGVSFLQHHVWFWAPVHSGSWRGAEEAVQGPVNCLLGV